MAMALATNGGVVPEGNSSWPHQGHRLWASMSEAFWVYEYKVRRCPNAGSHDWRLCPYAHPGERARRRDPRRYPYLAVPCPNHHNRAGTSCPRGLYCRYAHGVFELWLHPKRFRTRMCDAGTRCARRICFVAHCPAQQRRGDDGDRAAMAPLFQGEPSMPPYIVHQYLPLPPSSSSSQLRPSWRPRAVDVVEAAALPPRRPLDNIGASLSSSSSASTAVVATLASSSADCSGSSSSAGSSISSSLRAVQDPDSDDDDHPFFDSILDGLERLIME
ncbi:hypothetical protein QOZ80_7AG0580940 [Eleusine coracana subsp. coracana]|nr:hypothetical protein QOZ80_7AG0580940 [Eleusine coracana subsp. coracana]